MSKNRKNVNEEIKEEVMEEVTETTETTDEEIEVVEKPKKRIPCIKIGDDIGWNINNDGFIEVDFSSQLTEDEKPVLVLDYYVEPRFD